MVSYCLINLIILNMTLYKTIALLGVILFSYVQINAQKIQDTTNIYKLKEVVVSASKDEENKKTVSQQIEVITSKEIQELNVQNTADVLSQTGAAFVQKSQQGGGSPILRGFEASRVLLVIDGVRMNNLIYRSGHLQNLITTDQNILERIEVMYGPATTVYGSDALGGVVNLITKNPLLNKINGSVFSRYSSVNKERTLHADVNFGFKKFASLTSFTFNEFDDVMMGKNKNPYAEKFEERNFIPATINSRDTLLPNTNKYLQTPSGYNQFDVLQKFLFQQNEKLQHILNLQLTNSSDIPRYDRLSNFTKTPSNSEWYYGPQYRMLASYQLVKKVNAKGIAWRLTASSQDIEESRITRSWKSTKRITRTEAVKVYGLTFDWSKKHEKLLIRGGFDSQFNNLKSTASAKNIITDAESTASTRYPGGANTLFQTSIFGLANYSINTNQVISASLRIGYSMLQSNFTDKSFYPFPFDKVVQNTPVYSGSIGYVNSLNDNIKISATLSSGYRVANIDDLTKVFDSQKGNVIIPNSTLKPEQTYNAELGITCRINEKFYWENVGFYTLGRNMFALSNSTFKSSDSILYDGKLSRVQTMSNATKTYMAGFTSTLRYVPLTNLMITASGTYTHGRIVVEPHDLPLDHIPPFYSRFSIRYSINKFTVESFMILNLWKRLSEYSTSGEDNLSQATPVGMPSWYTLNLRANYTFKNGLIFQTGVDNILDTQYRTFASGINAPGRNVFVTVRYNF